MKRLRAWVSRLAGLVPSERRERELADEIESHLQMHVDDNLRSGMTPEAARRDALLKLGGVESTREACRERSTIPLIEHVLQDVRFALRQLARNPGFTLTAVLVLALGLGASATIFGFVHAALIKPLPYTDPARLVNVTESAPQIPRAALSYPDYLDWKRLNTVFTSIDVHSGRSYMLSTPAGTEVVPGARVSDGFFRTLGVTPLLGRGFHEGEDLADAPHTVILSFTAWRDRFGGRPEVIGQAVTLSDTPHTVIGVLPREFHFTPRGRAELWTTLHPAGSCDLRRSCHALEGIGRLKDGVSIETALAEMKSIAAGLEREYPDSNRGQGASVVPLAEVMVGNVRPLLMALLGGAGLLLLIACVNVASLLLVRSESRKREFAVRGALGASRARLIRQFVTESLVLVAGGAVAGVILAAWAMPLLTRLIPADMMAATPYLRGLGLNPHVLAFAGGVSLVAALLFSATPIVRSPWAGMREGLTEGGRSAAGTVWRRLGSNLVVVELAIAVVLLVGAGLLGKSVYRLLKVDLGFEPDHLATLAVAAPPSRYANDEQAVALGRRVLGRIASLPGVEAVGITSLLPVTFNGNTDWIRFVGRPYSGEHIEVNQRDVSADYFKALRARLLRGRYFSDTEDASKPRVVVINRTLARRYFPDEDPIGKRFGDTSLSPGSIKEIIGVVDDIREGPLDAEIWPAVYYPYNQDPAVVFFSLIVRTAQDAESALPALSAAIRDIDPDLGIIREVTMRARIGDSPSAYLRRSSAWLIGGFAGLALLLGVVGLYGVIAYSVGQRAREIGVRMALGAPRGSLYRLILMEAGQLAALGITLGVGAAVASATLMRKLLFDTPAWDMPTLAAVAATLAVSALLASYVPARRAASVDPLDALRAE
jgi:predicted permease